MKKLLFSAGIVLALFLLAAAIAPAAFAQEIPGDKVVAGENYVLEEGQTLDGNLLVLGGTATVENGATVDGDVTVLGGFFSLAGTVNGNVALLGGSADLLDTAVVQGDLSSLGGSVTRAPGSVVQGETNRGFALPNRVMPVPTAPGFSFQDGTPRSWFSRFVGWQFGTVGSILLMGLLGLVLIVVAPRGVGRVSSALAVQPGLAFIFGLLTLVLGVLAGAILLIACGLGLLVWGTLVAASVLGWIGVAVWLGHRLLKALNQRNPSSVAQMLVGVVIITLLSRLPCVGWLFWLVFASWGLGAVVLTRFGTRDADAVSRPALPPTGGTGGSFAPLPAASDLDTAATPEAAVDTADLGASAELTRIAGIDAGLAARLREDGIRTMGDVANSHPVALATATGVPVGQIMTEDWIGQAQRML